MNKPDYKLAKKRNLKITFNTYSDSTAPIGNNKTFYIKTYGCQSNVRDSEDIKGILLSLGFNENPNILDADLVILNTCAIRENAEKKVFGEIGYLKAIKIKNENFKFGICGCMAQEENVVKKIINNIEHVDFVFGTHNIASLANILAEVYKTNKQIIDIKPYSEEITEQLPTKHTSNIKAFVNITYGCNKFCTYCIVPYTRGQLRSRKKEDIINEINNLIKQGYKEVTLLGQNVNDYGIDLYDDYGFVELLEEIAKTNINRIRFATSNPWNFSTKIIDIAKKYQNIMPYFHLPIQSGDETILKKMNREMEIKKYLDLVNYIKHNINDYAISTDIIVGFPNETEKEFENTIKLYDEVKFDNAYTFIYSPRENTPAANFVDNETLTAKQWRLNKLNDLVRKYAKENCMKYVDKTVEVLVEGYSKTDKNILFGYSRNWKVVNFSGTAKPGDIVHVKITSASRFSLNGVEEKIQ
ncbi:MAG: tRNA (N6-isopentenyl adenosine(37)-C2)-methylthiotransferase MiaB [Mycoplasmataceae bacterium]|nr:tRNA (N6-isopentenyl adenosine(37)-C2)-methylthiotransferase MiaB [Mycoplasmataceae bacterium]